MADETLVEAALRVLNTSDPFEKAGLGDNVASRWLNGAISSLYDPSADLPVPDRPARLSNVLIRLLPHLIVYILIYRSFVDCNCALEILCVDATSKSFRLSWYRRVSCRSWGRREAYRAGRLLCIV